LYHSPPGYASTQYYTSSRRPAYSAEKVQSKGGFFYSYDSKSRKTREHSARPEEEHSQGRKDRKSKPKFFDDEGYYSSRTTSPQGSSPPPYHDTYDRWKQDAYTREHETNYENTEPIYQTTGARTTSNSYYAEPQPSQPPPHDPRTPPKATDADAARAHIPAGYSYKNWDPTEEPILLLGSVFDANSLGKWIYDWTIFHHGPASSRAELAGELWLALIKLAGKIKRAEEGLPRIRRLDEHDLVDDFLESGERIWRRFNKILKNCEDDMWRAAKKEAQGKGGSVAMGAKSGCAFVDAMFGRDRNLGITEKLMDSILLWSKRFDANCDDILRNPSG